MSKAPTKPRTAALPTRFRQTSRDRVLVTPEGVSLPLTLASRGARAGALMLDLFFIGLAMTLTSLALAGVAGGAIGGAARSGGGGMKTMLEFLFILWVAAMFLFRNAYFLFFELGPRGATPGKRIAGIRIAARGSGDGGGRLSAEMVIARNLLRDIELFLPIVFIAAASDGGDVGAAGVAAAAWFLIFALFPVFNRDRLRAGDLIAGSWVVEAPKRRLEAAMSVSPSLAGAAVPAGGQVEVPTYRFGEAELSVYGEYELQMLERVLRDDRPESLEQVYEAICRKIGWTQGGPGDARPFLEAYYRQLRARLEAGMRLGKRKADKFAL